MSLLVVAAHPDDEVLGCGGTLARRAAEGVECHVLILGEGATSRAATRAEADRTTVKDLQDASRLAARDLGVAEVHHAGLPDNRFDEVALLEIVKQVEHVIDAVRPSTVLVQHGGDVNIDHQRTWMATLAATRPQPGQPVRRLCSFQVASSTEWAFHTIQPPFHPNLYVDVSDHLDAKLRAMARYGDELRPPPHPRSLERIEVQARHNGATVGVDAAEAFAVVRVVE